ncbi:MAG: lipocalin family protein [Hoylesella marshii]|uniref:lipocalin family protein n=1 Tax=Hoylesella marshii TaxID=189722 RepID=UPI003F9EDD7C
MKAIKLIPCLIALMICASGCHLSNKNAGQPSSNDSLSQTSSADTTVYGICGDGTSMHNLELLTDEGNTFTYLIDDEDATPVVKGGLLAGDRMAVVGNQIGDERMATTVINLTTLMGKWTSLDKNFELKEGGLVESHVQAESNPYTSWKIFNGQLLLNRDTFTINTLGADSLMLENRRGIFVYKRQK